VLFACQEVDLILDAAASAVTAFQLKPDKSLEPMGSVSTGGGSACHASVHPSGRFIAVANHGLPPGSELDAVSGSVAVISIADDGNVMEQTCWVPHLNETDPTLLSDPRRADWTSHAHSANFDSTGRWLFVCEKGLDRVIVYDFDETRGSITPHSECMVPIGNAARHLAVHPDKVHIYVNEEAGNMVTCYDFDAEAGVLTRRQTLGTLPAGRESIQAATSECELSPDGQMLHVCNRVDENSIASYAVDVEGDGSLRLCGHTPCGNHPRHFAIHGQWMLVCALGDMAVNVLRLDQNGVPHITAERKMASFYCGFPATHALFLEPWRAAVLGDGRRASL
jgi:6-phosphogluconolactonase